MEDRIEFFCWQREETDIIDVDAAEVGVVEPGQHVDAQAGGVVAVAVDGARRIALAIAAGPVADVHHTWKKKPTEEFATCRRTPIASDSNHSLSRVNRTRQQIKVPCSHWEIQGPVFCKVSQAKVLNVSSIPGAQSLAQLESINVTSCLGRNVT